MTFGEMQDRVRGLLEIGGYLNTEHPPAVGALLNRAYRDYVWYSQSNYEVDETLVTTAGQAHYVLPEPQWRSISQVYVNQQPIDRVAPGSLRVCERGWLYQPAGTVRGWWRPNLVKITLWPTPATADLVVALVGFRLLPDMLDEMEEPQIPDVHCEDLCKRAYWYEAERSARGEELQALLGQVEQYRNGLIAMASEFAGSRMVGASRRPNVPEADRVSV